MRKRHSVRDFAPDTVPEAVIRAVIATAAYSAPWGPKPQPWHFAAIADPAMKARIRAAAEEEERAFYNSSTPTNGWQRWNRSAPAPPNPT